MQELWEIERSLWLLGSAEMARHLAEGCVLALPGMGIISRVSAIAGMETRPRWAAVEMTGRRAFATDEVVVLGYHAQARRSAEPDYKALVTSCWHRSAEGWRIIQHQHTPLT